MSETVYRGRRACLIENGVLDLVVTIEGGHIAAVTDKTTKINPLWSPPWPSLEPSQYERAKHPQYGDNSESKLLAGIMGHNLCMDIFGGPSEAEAAAGMTVHGEASIVPYEITTEQGVLTQRATFPQAQLRFERRITFHGPTVVQITEAVENLSALDRPIAW